MTSVRSFDFWDTLVTRLVMRPVQVFELMERISGIEGFAKSRIEAETQSRRAVKETNLGRIYSHLGYEKNVKETLMTLELEVETKLSSLIVETALQFNESDIVLSDMYLSSSDLIKIAENCGLKIASDSLFVSSEHAATKYHGELFDLLRERYEIESHIGDNLRSDFQVPESKGIKATHFNEHKPSSLELEWAKRDGDSQYMAGVMRGARLACPSASPIGKKQWSIFSQIVAPVLFRFVEWILDDCKRHNIKDIFFLARDGQVLQQIASDICKSRNLSFNCQYIYASRQALHLPGYVSIEKAETWLLDNTAYLSLTTLAERSGINIEEMLVIAFPWLNVSKETNLDNAQRAQLKQVIRSASFEKAIKASSEKAFKAAAKYYSDVGLFPSEINQVKAIVDVGWNGRLQASLDNIFLKIGYASTSLHGYYLALSKKCIYSNGTRVHGYLSDPFDAQNFNPWVDRYRGMIELFLAADHPSSIGFDLEPSTGISSVRFGPALAIEQVDQVRFRQAAVMSFVSALLKFEAIAKFRISFSKDDVITNFWRLLAQPTHIEAASFKNDFVSEQQVERELIPMVKRVKLIDLFSEAHPHKWGCWQEGSFAFSRLLWVHRTKKAILMCKDFWCI